MKVTCDSGAPATSVVPPANPLRPTTTEEPPRQRLPPTPGCPPVLCDTMCLDGYEHDVNGCSICECRQAGARSRQVPAFSKELEYISFNFNSLPVEVQRRGVVGRGELRLDVRQRRLYLHSTLESVSIGIPLVESRIIYRGDRNRLYAATRVAANKRWSEWDKCWSVRTAEALPSPPRDQRQNPLLLAQRAPRSASSWAHGGTAAELRVLELDGDEAVEFYVNTAQAVTRMTFLGEEGVKENVEVVDWSTAPLDDAAFEMADDSSEVNHWECANLELLGDADSGGAEAIKGLADRSLFRIFLPIEDVDLPM